MTAQQLISAAKNNSWTNVNSIIENSGLEINLIQNLPFLKMWEVKNNKEITHITNTMKCCGENISKLTFCWNC
jgi:ABC-type metal ion transport system substrate-binding protein